jgi:VWFA-related protein
MRTLSAAALLILLAGHQGAPSAQQTPDPQRPVFRAGAHYVRVDVYPTRNGTPVRELKASDFELLEDGKPQQIETFEFIESPTFTPDAERRDPNSQRDGFELARNPQYRLFVLYLDAFHVSFDGSHRSRRPIIDFLNRMIGPKDLFGVMTPAQTVNDLMIGQLTQTIEQQLTDHPTWGIGDRYQPQPGEEELEFIYGERLGRYLVALRRLDKVYGDLEGLVIKLGDLRDERKNIVFFSDYLASPRTNLSQMAIDPTNSTGAPPRIGVTSEGKLTTGRRNSAEPDRRWAEAERARLTSIDFDRRFRDLLRHARQANVAFYTVRPGGLDPNYSMLSEGISNLRVLAEQTDGAAVGDSNDLSPGLRKVADDLSSHYVLGYYTSNTNWNGGTRQITVRLKGSKDKLRARREYRAPTAEEMESLRAARSASATPAPEPSPVAAALDLLARVRPGSIVAARGTATRSEVALVAELAAAEIEGGRWKQGADVQVMMTDAKGTTLTGRGRIEPGARGTLIKIPVADQSGPWEATLRIVGEGQPNQMASVSIQRSAGKLIGDATGYRAAALASAAWRPLAVFQFRRTERLRLEFPILQSLDGHASRLLDRKGQPLQVPVTTSVAGTMLVAEVNLAPLSIGDYVLEVSANAAGASEQRFTGIHVAMAR